ncbi:MAG TPA: PP2C family protein-serine/threonine phosphatase [Thermoanaerobaculia bacterium]|nr:PP2C family protein-serine/threonine phosphatase [Thermoanaerobaculia bacterium]
MARLRDWVDLGKSTFHSLKLSDATRFYETEWPETRRMLIADHADAIENERKRLRRFVRTRSAELYGLAKRLAPLRRVVFFIAFVWFFALLIDSLRGWRFVEMAACFMLLVVLLAMELIDKIKYRDELELARDLQADLIPKHPATTAEYDIAAFNEIANTVGGDIYDFVPLPDGRLAVLFGDASGHGMAAGLVMAVAHAAFRTQLDVDPSPGAIVTALNRILCRTGGPRSFFACCYMLLSPSGDFVAITAGHPEILKIDGSGKVIDHIGSGSYPLGIKSGLTWPEMRGSIVRGQKLLFHSDGLTEARNRLGREFGDAYVEAVVSWNPAASPSALVQMLADEFHAFAAGHLPEDDVSVAVVSFQ